MAKKEELKGVQYGCSLALFPEKCSFEQLKNKKIEALNEEDMIKITNSFQEAFNRFIMMSIAIDTGPIDPQITFKRQYVSRVIDQCRFSILEYNPFINPKDIGHVSYGGLGKFGPNNIESQKITRVPPPTPSECGAEETSLNELMGSKSNEVINKVIDGFRSSILKTLREFLDKKLQNNNSQESNPNSKEEDLNKNF